MRCIVGIGVALALATPAAASCTFRLGHVEFGMDVSATATADSGQTCNIHMNEEGARIDSFFVIRQPAHGQVSVTHYGTYEWVYTPKAGYKGPDVFALSITGQAYGGYAKGTSKMTVTIEVQ
jgi:hypothetical protein